ncbi:hypothetical protein ACOSP7_026737 [Xanthoceras sorbifolium]
MLHIQSRNVLGKEFLCIQDAEEYYHKYSYLKRFNVRKDDLRCDKNGLITNKYVEQTNRVRQPRAQTCESCRATMRVNINCQKMVWVVKEFVTEHSHNLTSGKHMRFLHSHRNVTDHMVDQPGSYASVGHTKRTCDTELILSAEQYGMLGNLFWADSMSCNDYRKFGDVMSFDSTYKTNAYLRLLVIFVGVNHHNNTTVFGFRQLVDETVEMSSCILKTFLLAMLGFIP